MNEPERFEDAMAELDRIVQLLERGQASLEESLAAFERGVRLVRHCRGVLSEAELRVQQLVSIDEQGQATLREFDHSPTHEAERNPKRKRDTAATRRVSEPPSKPEGQAKDDSEDLFEGIPG